MRIGIDIPGNQRIHWNPEGAGIQERNNQDAPGSQGLEERDERRVLKKELLLQANTLTRSGSRVIKVILLSPDLLIRSRLMTMDFVVRLMMLPSLRTGGLNAFFSGRSTDAAAARAASVAGNQTHQPGEHNSSTNSNQNGVDHAALSGSA